MNIFKARNFQRELVKVVRNEGYVIHKQGISLNGECYFVVVELLNEKEYTKFIEGKIGMNPIADLECGIMKLVNFCYGIKQDITCDGNKLYAVNKIIIRDDKEDEEDYKKMMSKLCLGNM